MATMDCKQFLNQLDAWLEGEKPPDAEAHAADCPNCRAVVEDFRAIASAASVLRDESPEPPVHLWNSIREQLEKEGIIREPQAQEAEAPSRGWRGWFARFPRPALAGAYLCLLVIAGFALSGPITKRVNDYRWIRGTRDSTAPLGAHLDSVEHATMASFASNPVVTAALQKNLLIVDNYISLCEKSVHEEPQSEIARDYLYDAYQQKADLLAQMNERGE
jgi:hypothetical protein